MHFCLPLLRKGVIDKKKNIKSYDHHRGVFLDPLYQLDDKCMVMINGNKTVQNCAPKFGGCDLTIGRMKICCCNTEKCNDAAFVEKCKAGTAPTSSPKGFTCIAKQPGTQYTMDQECSSMFLFFSFFSRLKITVLH